MIIGPHAGDTTANLNPIIAAFKEIGYRDKLIQFDYEFADFFEKSVSTRQIKIGVFGQETLNYRSACFGVDVRKPEPFHEDLVSELRAFGSPVIFVVRNGMTRSWQNTGQRLIPRDEVKTEYLPNLIRENKEIWKPEKNDSCQVRVQNPGTTAA